MIFIYHSWWISLTTYTPFSHEEKIQNLCVSAPPREAFFLFLMNSEKLIITFILPIQLLMPLPRRGDDVFDIAMDRLPVQN